MRDENPLARPYTVAGAVNRRLSWARSQEGLTVEAWHARLVGEGYTVARSTVAKYELSMKKKRAQPTMPPFDYLARVSEVFGYRLEWLASGTGEPKNLLPDADTVRSVETLFEGQLFGTLVNHLDNVGWARGTARRVVLRLLSEAEGAARDLSEGEREALLKRVAAYLDGLVPLGHPDLAPITRLSPFEREHVALHVRGLMYLLFLPFRAANVSATWSRVLSRREALEPDSVTPDAPPAGKAEKKGARPTPAKPTTKKRGG